MNARNILRENQLGFEEEPNRDDEGKYFGGSMPKGIGRVSLTRNKDFNKLTSQPYLKDASVSFVLDGDSISNNYKIKPFQWDPSHKWSKGGEAYKDFVKKYGEREDQFEEAVPFIKNIDRYIIKVVFYPDTFGKSGDDQDLEPDEIQEVYDEIVSILESKNISYEAKR